MKAIMRNRMRLLAGLLGLMIIVLLLVPTFASRFTVFVLYLLFLNIALAQSWNLVGGYTGLISLGHAAFFGIGAYSAAIFMSQLNMPFLIAVLAGGLLATIFAVIIAFPTFRFRGVYFAIGTLILAEALRIWMINWEFTGGAQGVRFPISRIPSLNEFYYIMLVAAVAATAVLILILRQKLGLGLRAIRDNEGSAQNMGVSIFRTKLFSFAISAFMAGLIGAIHATRLSVIEPYSIFGVSWTIAMINIVIIGGMGTIVGPIVGAIFITFLGEALADFYTVHLMITGLIFILVIRFMPQGIWGWIRELSLAKRIADWFSGDSQIVSEIGGD